jgi:hypothetical protein
LTVEQGPPAIGLLELHGLLMEGERSGSPMNLLTLVEQFFRREHSRLLVGCHRRIPRGGSPELVLRLAPTDPGLRFIAEDSDRLRVLGDPLFVGPGYRLFLSRELVALGKHIRLRWMESPRIGPDEASALAHERLAQEAREALDRLTLSGQPQNLLLLPGHHYHHDGVVSTPFGPRDMRWLAQAAVGGLRAQEVFPWPEGGLGARTLLGRALSLIWTELRWRKPFTSAEAASLAEVDDLLQRARDAEPGLDLPWSAWAAVQGWLGLEGASALEVRRRALSDAAIPGFRRWPVRVQLSGAWSLTIPGSMAESWEEDGTFCGEEHGRALWATVMVGPRARQPARLAEEPGSLHHEGFGVAGQATVGENPEDPGSYVLSAQSFSEGSAVVVTACFSDPSDLGWAEEAWRSLRRDVTAISTAEQTA